MHGLRVERLVDESQPGGRLKVSIRLVGQVERLDRLVTPLESIDSKLAPRVFDPYMQA